MKRKQYVFFCCISLLLFATWGLTACSDETETKRGADWDYTVVPTQDCPQDFLEEIEKKKMNAFQMTYDDGEYRYLAVGYGEQEKNGFSIQVQGIYEKGDTLCMDTSLVGPNEDEIVLNKKSYPYLVVKVQKTGKKVEFFT